MCRYAIFINGLLFPINKTYALIKYLRKFINELPNDHLWRKSDTNPNDDGWLVKVKWEKTFNESDAKSFKGIFANPNVVCRLKDINTLNFLFKEFEVKEENI